MAWQGRVCFLLVNVFLAVSSALSAAVSVVGDDNAVLHINLARRDGAFSSTVAGQDHVDLARLADAHSRAEAQFSGSQRIMRDNRLVRQMLDKGGLGSAKDAQDRRFQSSGAWHGNISIGLPPQPVEFDVDLLGSDLYVVTTTSAQGSRYDDLFSRSYEKSNTLATTDCRLPSDVFHFPESSTNDSQRIIRFAHCRPPKYSLGTLGSSGGILGLAPSKQSTGTGLSNIIFQLVERGLIHDPIFSLMLINDREGVLSIGGTTADEVETIVAETELALDKIGAVERGEMMMNATNNATTAFKAGKVRILELEKRRNGRRRKSVTTRQSNWQDEWVWSKVIGAAGWWQVLLQGIWIDDSKVLQNQAVVIDLNTPFILAPRAAAETFYASIPGARALDPPHSQFYIFPCLNPPRVAFEFGGGRIPLLQGARGGFGDWNGLPGGRFSLGRLRPGSGYCVGAVVAKQSSDLNIQTGRGRSVKVERPVRSMSQQALLRDGDSLKDIWILGEGFFRGIGVVFDMGKEKRVGFRKY